MYHHLFLYPRCFKWLEIAFDFLITWSPFQATFTSISSDTPNKTHTPSTLTTDTYLATTTTHVLCSCKNIIWYYLSFNYCFTTLTIPLLFRQLKYSPFHHHLLYTHCLCFLVPVSWFLFPSCCLLFVVCCFLLVCWCSVFYTMFAAASTTHP